MTEYQVHRKIVPDAWELTRRRWGNYRADNRHGVSVVDLRTALQIARLQLQYGPVFIHILDNKSSWIYECNSHKDIALHFD